MAEQSFEDQLLHCTTRIECDIPGGKSIGSGFFFDFKTKKGNVSTIITNKHVIKGATKGKLRFTVCDKNQKIISGKFHNIEINNFEKAWLLHPEKEIDLAIMPTQPLDLQSGYEEIELFRRSFDKGLIPDKSKIDELTAIEDVIMVGYPNGIWDQTNNLPLVRRGITATSVYNDYNNKKEFMVDMACFPGSSGSPIILYNPGIYKAKNGGTIVGTRVYLLGILYAGPQHTAKGKLEIINIPTTETICSISRIPNNLGVVIKAEKILDFEPILEKLIHKQK